jgi:hypothetical protein
MFVHEYAAHPSFWLALFPKKSAWGIQESMVLHKSKSLDEHL